MVIQFMLNIDFKLFYCDELLNLGLFEMALLFLYLPNTYNKGDFPH
jgi:hypothetical protein